MILWQKQAEPRENIQSAQGMKSKKCGEHVGKSDKIHKITIIRLNNGALEIKIELKFIQNNIK